MTTLLKPTLPRPTTYRPARRWREYIRQQLGGTYPSPVPSVFLEGITDTLAVYVTHPEALNLDHGVVEAVCQIAAAHHRLPVIIVLIEHSTDSLTALGDVHRECFARGCWLQPYNCFE
jgi:hypothetical protein